MVPIKIGKIGIENKQKNPGVNAIITFGRFRPLFAKNFGDFTENQISFIINYLY
jgi:hypothetical protein